MSNQLKVAKDLQFKGHASHTTNVEGNISCHKVVLYDDFDGKAIDNTYDYTVAAIGAGTATVTVPHSLTLTTAGSSEDDVDFATEVCFYGQYNATIEARIRNDDVSASCYFFGFSDAQGEAADKLAFLMNSTGDVTGICTDGAGFIMDSDATAAGFINILFGVTNKNGTIGDVITGTTGTVGDASYKTLRVELRNNVDSTTVDVLFYVNKDGKSIVPSEDFVGQNTNAITRTTALCGYIGYLTREAGVNTLDVDYWKIWSDRAWGTST